jgi:hypothetical protein
MPVAADFVNHSGERMVVDQMVRAEKLVLTRFLKWKLDAVTVYHFLEAYLVIGIVFTNDKVHGKRISMNNVKMVEEKAVKICELAAKTYKFKFRYNKEGGRRAGKYTVGPKTWPRPTKT